MAFVDKLIKGQLETDASRPLDYCTPDAFFVGMSYQGVDYKEGVYMPKTNNIPKFFLPINFTPRNIINHALNFVKKNYQTFIVPTIQDDNIVIGFSHKLKTNEAKNLLVALNNIEILDIDNPEIAKSIRKNHPYLKGTSIIKDGVIDYTAANKSIAVYDETNDFYIYSLVNGAKPEFIERLVNVDVRHAFDIVTDKVKVPVNNNQLIALISLAYDIGKTRFATSKLLKSLNTGDYNCATFFMEFAERPIKNGTGVSTILYDRRVAEANLFSSIQLSL